MHAISTLLSAISTPAPMPLRVVAFERAHAAYLDARERGEAAERCAMYARDRALRALQIVPGSREIARLAIVAACETPAPLELASPDPTPAPAELAPLVVARRHAGRLPRAAYVAAHATRAALAPDLVDAFDRVWRSLWPSLGRATLAEVFGEWCESHERDLLDIQCETAERGTRRLEREMDRVWRARATAAELATDDAYLAAERQALAGVPF